MHGILLVSVWYILASGVTSDRCIFLHNCFAVFTHLCSDIMRKLITYFNIWYLWRHTYATILHFAPVLYLLRGSFRCISGLTLYISNPGVSPHSCIFTHIRSYVDYYAKISSIFCPVLRQFSCNMLCTDGLSRHTHTSSLTNNNRSAFSRRPIPIFRRWIIPFCILATLLYLTAGTIFPRPSLSLRQFL